jgi:tetratricopeptide (TPR) repeat protein
MPLPPPGKKISGRGGDASADKVIDYDQAVEDCTRKIEEDPSNYAAFYFRGVAHRRKGNHTQAVKDLSRAIDLKPRYIDALKERAFCNIALGHPDLAQKDFREILRYEPKMADAWNWLGEAYNRTSEYDEAIRHFTRAIELCMTHSDAYFNRGEAYIAKGQYATACYNKGYSFYHQGKLDKALQEFSAGIKADPGFELNYVGKGQTLEAMRCYNEAVNEYKKIIKSATDQTAWHVDYARKLLNELLDRM